MSREPENERQSCKELDDHEPPGQELLPDEPVLVPVERVAAVEQVVELVVRVAEAVEAELPQAHVLERRLRVLPRDQPVRRGEAHHQQQAAEEAAQAPVEQPSLNKNVTHFELTKKFSLNNKELLTGRAVERLLGVVPRVHVGVAVVHPQAGGHARPTRITLSCMSKVFQLQCEANLSLI